MTLVRINKENLEHYLIVANPKFTFTSSSTEGVVGSIPLNPNESKSLTTLGSNIRDAERPFNIKDAQLSYEDNLVVATTVGRIRQQSNSTDPLLLDQLLRDSNRIKPSIRDTKKSEVRRFVPGIGKIVGNTAGASRSNFFRKSAVKNALMMGSRDTVDNPDFAFKNYHSLNFFTSPTSNAVPKSSVIMYPAPTGSLAPSTAFTFDFYLKPKSNTIPYTAGTILHMSSCYAITLITGSARDGDGKPDRFRLLFQLSSSADIPPRHIRMSGDNVTILKNSDNRFNKDSLVFATPDNSLKKDHWHHICIRWGGVNYNNGKCTISIDGKTESKFVLTSSVVMFTGSSNFSKQGQVQPNVLFVGNYYEGINYGASNTAYFFAGDTAEREGSFNFKTVSGYGSLGDGDPANYRFKHPLNAEVHDIKIYDSYIRDRELNLNMIQGPSVTGSTPGEGYRHPFPKFQSNLKFYLPPFFVKESPRRQVLKTPFRSAIGTTETPFNTELSFGLGGLEINLENYTRDFINKKSPRLFHLSSSAIVGTVGGQNVTANDALYASESFRKRNLTILPCDNGKFYPNFKILSTASFGSRTMNLDDEDNQAQRQAIMRKYNYHFDGHGILKIDRNSPSMLHEMGRFVNDLDKLDLSLVSLNKLVFNTNKILKGIEGNVVEDLLELPTPEELAEKGSVAATYRMESEYGDRNSVLTIFNRTRDSSSNEIVFFDISNLMYGDSIKKGTLVITENNVTGSGGAENFVIKDNGEGSLYRDNTSTKPAKWNSIGNIFYDEGIIILKSPHLPMFGKDEYKIEFEGLRQIYVLEVVIHLRSGVVNESKNQSYKDMVPSDYISEIAEKFVYISGINLHDRNLNVLAKASLAQPIIKREADRIMFKIRLDF